LALLAATVSVAAEGVDHPTATAVVIKQPGNNGNQARRIIATTAGDRLWKGYGRARLEV